MIKMNIKKDDVVFVDDVHGDRAGVDVEHAAGQRRPFLEPGLAGGALVHRAAEVGRLLERRQRVIQFFEAEFGEQLAIETALANVEQVRA